MAEQQDMSALLRHFEDELEGISAFCTTNSSEDAEEALSQAEALLSRVVAFAGLFVSDESDGDALVQAVISVVQAIQSHLDTLQRSVARHRGRPQIHVSEEQLVMLLDLYFTVRDIASMLQVSRDTVRRNLKSQGTSVPGMEALLVMLRRLSYPSRLCDLIPLFGRSKTDLSIIFNKILDDVYTRFSHLLTDLDLVWMDPGTFASAIQAKGSPLNQCIGFIDGTVRPIARPTVNQRIMYSGHKRVHCLKFQSVVTPNGLIAHLFGPIEGRRHAFMLSVSGLPNKLQSISQANNSPYVLYGDPAYGISSTILSPFRGVYT